jgi:hypothetical protein
MGSPCRRRRNSDVHAFPTARRKKGKRTRMFVARPFAAVDIHAAMPYLFSYSGAFAQRVFQCFSFGFSRSHGGVSHSALSIRDCVQNSARLCIASFSSSFIGVIVIFIRNPSLAWAHLGCFSPQFTGKDFRRPSSPTTHQHNPPACFRVYNIIPSSEA